MTAIELAKTPSFRLDGRRALVTGGGRGIGLAAASALADGRIRRDERALLFNCATGLKYPLPPVHRTLDRTKPIDYANL